ncbi:hypothetical protein SLS62_004309 [Diatrype stigma]|uniref:Sulfatase-modifying factor enzyme domain-containing protein n=1 Tax=Diatrype stigma TaxID=117547 RepID=A0AAN9UUU1_9PEZI
MQAIVTPLESLATFPSSGLGKGPSRVSKRPQVDIIDIQQATVEINLKEEIHRLFRPQEGPRTLPTLLLYDEKGLQLFEEVAHILQALEDAGKDVDYYALDLSKQELSRTLAQLPNYKHVRCHGLLGTYDDGREWLKKPSVASRPNHAYNDRDGVTHQFLLNGLRHANEILGQEAFNIDDWKVIGEYIYDAKGGRHQAFYAPKRDVVVLGETIRANERIQIEQSLKHSAEECESLWNSVGLAEVEQWMTDGDEYGLHLLAKSTMSFSLNPSEYASSHVPSLKDWEDLWAAWDAVTQRMLPNEELLDKPIKLRNACIFYLGHIPAFLDIQLTKTAKGAPTEPASYYDIFERGIDPDVDNPEQCHQHSETPDEWPPVEDILGYQGRVRARLAKFYASDGGGPQGEGISRDIGRAIWVGFEHEAMHLETLLYMMLQSDKTYPPPSRPRPNFEALAEQARAARVENEWFDIPQREITLGLDDPEDDPTFHGHFGWDNEKPPRKVEVHGFRAKGRPITNEEYARYMHENQVTKLPASWAEDIHNKNKDEIPSKPLDTATTTTNGVHGHSTTTATANVITPPSPSADDDNNGPPPAFLQGKAVRTVYGLVPLAHALDWPALASYDELAGCAAWLGGRIPTLEEARSLYGYADELAQRRRKGAAEAENQLGKTVPAVNGHLVNDGVEETPPHTPPADSVERGEGGGGGEDTNNNADDSDNLFVDLGASNANVGFQHWHPEAVTGRGDQLAGQGEMGGVWEWTSSPLRRHEGFEPMALYPAYTVLGGSWATHPRIAGRKTFINWYQRNYPYAWVGARLIQDYVV